MTTVSFTTTTISLTILKVQYAQCISKNVEILGSSYGTCLQCTPPPATMTLGNYSTPPPPSTVHPRLQCTPRLQYTPAYCAPRLLCTPTTVHPRLLCTPTTVHPDYSAPPGYSAPPTTVHPDCCAPRLRTVFK